MVVHYTTIKADRAEIRPVMRQLKADALSLKLTCFNNKTLLLRALVFVSVNRTFSQHPQVSPRMFWTREGFSYTY